MLAEVSLSLAAHSEILTIVAPTDRSLSWLRQQMPTTSRKMHSLRLDWAQREEFLSEIKRHIADVGEPSLVVAWLHDDNLGPELAGVLGSSNTRCLFFHVRGSEVASPMHNARTLFVGRQIPPNVQYNQIILGFKMSGGRSRWLSDSEISRGVLEAIEANVSTFVVGSTEPWSSRPL